MCSTNYTLKMYGTSSNLIKQNLFFEKNIKIHLNVSISSTYYTYM